METFIYNDQFFGDCVGRIEDNFIYNDQFFGDCIGRCEGINASYAAAALLLLL